MFKKTFFPQRMALQAISSATVHAGNIASGGEGRGFGPGQSPVLRIIVENLFYPVTLEVLQQVLSHSVYLLTCMIPGTGSTGSRVWGKVQFVFGAAP